MRIIRRTTGHYWVVDHEGVKIASIRANKMMHTSRAHGWVLLRYDTGDEEMHTRLSQAKGRAAELYHDK